jgi:hypothetical protein
MIISNLKKKYIQIVGMKVKGKGWRKNLPRAED